MEKISTVPTQHLFIKKYDDLQLAVFPGCQIEFLEIIFKLYCASLLESGKNWIITQASAGIDLLPDEVQNSALLFEKRIP